MNVFSRGVRNTFRNGVRTVSIVLILGLSIGLALSMLLARQAVNTKIQSVKSSIGTTVSISPAGVRGFEGGGEPLTTDELTKVKAVAHVTTVSGTLSDRLTTDNTSLQSAIDAGSLGRRFNSESGSSDSAGVGGMAAPGGSTDGSGDGQTRSFTPPVTVTGTEDSTNVGEIGAVTLKSGSQIDAKGSANEALIGAALATKNNLSVGSTFTAYGATITVKGIIDDTGNTFAGNQVVMPLKTLQTLSSQAGDVTAATVTVDSIDNVDSAVSAMKTALGSAADVTSAKDTAESAMAPLESIKGVSLFALIAAGAAGAAIILLNMVMIVRERRREIGVLKAIGASNGTITLQFVVEAMTFTVLAAVIGIVIGVVAANPITDTLVNNAQNSASATTTTGAGMGGRGMGGGFGQRALRGAGSVGQGLRNLSNVNAIIDWHILVYGLLAALLIAAVGSAVATWFITKVRPAEAIRAE